MRKSLVGLILTVALSPLGWSQELWIKTRRFEGPVRQHEGQLYAGLRELTASLELKVVENGDAVLVARPVYKGADTAAPGTLVVEGTVVETDGGNPPLVNVEQFAKALNLDFKPGRSENSFVLTPPFGWARGEDKGAAAAARAAPTLPAGPAPPLELNRTTPGADVEWRSMLVRGRINLVHFYKVPDKDKEYARQLQLLKDFAKDRSDVYLITINAGPFRSTPLTRVRQMGNVPCTFVFDRSLRLRQTFNGHSMNGALATWKENPATALDPYK